MNAKKQNFSGNGIVANLVLCLTIWICLAAMGCDSSPNETESGEELAGRNAAINAQGDPEVNGEEEAEESNDDGTAEDPNEPEDGSDACGLSCDDGDPCTKDECIPAIGCFFTPIDEDGCGEETEFIGEITDPPPGCESLDQSSCEYWTCLWDPTCWSAEWTNDCEALYIEFCGEAAEGGEEEGSEEEGGEEEGGEGEISDPPSACEALDQGSCEYWACFWDPTCWEDEWTDDCEALLAEFCGEESCCGSSPEVAEEGGEEEGPDSDCEFVCNDDDPCTIDECIPGVGCEFTFIDEEGCGEGPGGEGGSNEFPNTCDSFFPSDCEFLVCLFSPTCYEVEWTQDCEDLYTAICVESGQYGGEEGDQCKSVVCSTDPFCCEVEWDAICDQLELDLCDPPEEGEGESGSCDENCGGVAPEGCWCDAGCTEFGDCCPDACEACGSCGDGGEETDPDETQAPDETPGGECDDGNACTDDEYLEGVGCLNIPNENEGC